MKIITIRSFLRAKEEYDNLPPEKRSSHPMIDLVEELEFEEVRREIECDD